MEFFQFGILNKNKYIVELVHRDPEKTIPLYISTDGTGIYQIWYYYAKRLNMPTVIDTDEGTVKREVPELDKSLKEYLFAKGLIAVYEEAPKTPADIVCIKRRIAPSSGRSGCSGTFSVCSARSGCVFTCWCLPPRPSTIPGWKG